MNSKGNDSASDSEDHGRPDEASPHKDSSQAAPENDITSEDCAVNDNEAALLSREKSAETREDAALLRESVADVRENAAEVREDAAYMREKSAQTREGEASLREELATSREQEIRSAASRAESDEHINMLRQANENLVIANIEAQKLAEQIGTNKAKLEYLAHHDVLTGLPNRTLLQDRLIQAIALAHRQGRQLAVMFMDLDRFKNINDSLGHEIGDQLLQSVAQRLTGCVRQSDTISRQGGDEFMLLLATIEKAEDAALCAQKIVTALALPHSIGIHELHVSVSIGISIYPADAQEANSLVKNADTAMYYAKENGRNNYKFFEPEMNARAIQRQSIESGLRCALERKEFELFYQPKINLSDGAIVGAEALIRWHHPERGMVSPGQFVPIAEDCGMILPLDRWVLREACLQARSWSQAGLPPIIVAVNTSALDFRSKDFIDNLRETLKDTSFDPRFLEIEITESVLMEDAEFSATILHTLADMGVKLSIDDFGTGYSSLSYLSKFPIETLKIDQSFVMQMARNPDNATIVCAVINLAKSLNLHVIAEGVETLGQYSFLLDQHCDEGQGYYFGRPMAAETFANLLQTGLSPGLLC